MLQWLRRACVGAGRCLPTQGKQQQQQHEQHQHLHQQQQHQHQQHGPAAATAHAALPPPAAQQQQQQQPPGGEEGGSYSPAAFKCSSTSGPTAQPHSSSTPASCDVTPPARSILQGAGEQPPQDGQGRYILSDGKPVGIANTVSKYRESMPLVPHCTPFEERVAHSLAEEERVAAAAAAAGEAHIKNLFGGVACH